MSKVLLTNNHLQKFAGSEIVTLELAEEFKRRGWQVTVFSCYVAQPIRAHFENLRVELTTTAPSIFDFELVWIHHRMLPLCLEASMRHVQQGRPLPRIVYNHMSPFERYEFPTAMLEREFADCILANSPETFKALEHYDLPSDRYLVFPNPAPRSFLDVPPAGGRLESLLVVSNHLPWEVEKAVELLAHKHSVKVRIIGEHYESRKLSAADLASCDAVVSIGKTVQYALAAGRAVFCYDRFGGPGWITERNLESAADRNFSGRCTETKLSPQALAAALLDGYAEAQAANGRMRELASRRFSLPSLMDELLARLKALPTRDAAEVFGRIRPADLASFVDFRQLVAREFLSTRKSFERIAELEAQLRDLEQENAQLRATQGLPGRKRPLLERLRKAEIFRRFPALKPLALRVLRFVRGQKQISMNWDL